MQCRSPTSFLRWQEWSVQFEWDGAVFRKIPPFVQQRDRARFAHVIRRQVLCVGRTSPSSVSRGHAHKEKILAGLNNATEPNSIAQHPMPDPEVLPSVEPRRKTHSFEVKHGRPSTVFGVKVYTIPMTAPLMRQNQIPSLKGWLLRCTAYCRMI